MTTLNNTLQLLQLQIAHSQSSTFGAFAAAPHHPGIPTLPAPQVPALLVHNGLNKNDLHDPTVPVAVQVVLQSSMLENDNLALYLNDTPVEVNTISPEDMQSGIVTFLVSPSQFPQDGEVTLHYHHIVPPSTSFSVSESVGPFLVKQSVPGNPDPEPSTPHVNEHLTPPTGIPDMVPAGQALTVTIPRYVNIAEHDEIVLHWSNREITKTLTADEANNSSTPLTISVPADIIDSTPGIGLIVRYDIHDTVKNWSLYSLEARTDVIPPGALYAPTVRDANDYDELDMDELDGADVAIQIPVNGNLPVGTEGVLTWTGLPVIGPRLTYTASFKIERAATRITLYVPNDKAAALVGSAGTVFYEATINGVSTPSQRTSVQVIGQPVTLEKPTLTDVTGDTYNPALVSGSHQQVIVPAYSFMASGQTVILHWQGLTASGSGLFTQVTKRLTSDTPQDLDFLIDKVFATGLGTNTTLKVYYEIDVEGTAYVSPALELTVVGVPSNLPKPTTEPVFPGGEVDPGVVGATVKVVVEPNSTLLAGDMLTIRWEGSGASTSVTNRPFPASGNLEVPIGKEPYISGNINGYVEVWYEARRNSQPVGSSQRLVLHVNEPSVQPWPLPRIVDASQTEANPWQPIRPGTGYESNTATVVVNDARIQSGDVVAVVWRLPSGEVLPIPHSTTNAGNASIPIAPAFLAASLGKTVEVAYVVFRGVQVVGSSEVIAFVLEDLRPALLRGPQVVEAVGGQLDLNTVTGNATVMVEPWPFIQAGQMFWLRIQGVRDDGSDYSERLPEPYTVQTAEVVAGIRRPVPRTVLLRLENASIVTIQLKVDLAGAGTESSAKLFPLGEVVMKTLELNLIAPTVAGVVDGRLDPETVPGTGVIVQVPAFGGRAPGQRVYVEFTGQEASHQVTAEREVQDATTPMDFTISKAEVLNNNGEAVRFDYKVARVDGALFSASKAVPVVVGKEGSGGGGGGEPYYEDFETPPSGPANVYPRFRFSGSGISGTQTHSFPPYITRTCLTVQNQGGHALIEFTPPARKVTFGLLRKWSNMKAKYNDGSEISVTDPVHTEFIGWLDIPEVAGLRITQLIVNPSSGTPGSVMIDNMTIYY